MPEEIGEHLIRDQRPFLRTESLQNLQIPSTMLILSAHFSAQWHIYLFFWYFWITFWLENPTTVHYKAFWPQDSTICLQLSSCVPWRVFGLSNYLPHIALGQYRHRQYTVCRLVKFSVDCNVIIFVLIVEMEMFNALDFYFVLFSWLHILWSSTIFCCTSELYS